MLFQDPLFLIAAGASLVVLVILVLGVGSFARGGEFNRKHANRLMRYRLAAQFAAVILIVAFAWFKMRG